MRIKVHQIDNKLDRYNTGFRSYDSVLKTAGQVDPSIYKTVYDGNVDTDNLEAIYTLCNTDHPVGYNGHSMSVGDVVELEDGSCHFCDSFGFKELKDFDTSKVAPIVGHRMLVIEPHKAPYEMTIPDGLDPLQQAVKGYIEATYPFDDNAGTILIVADDGQGGTTDLTDEQIGKYTEMFKTPEDITPEEVQGDLWFRVMGFDE